MACQTNRKSNDIAQKIPTENENQNQNLIKWSIFFGTTIVNQIRDPYVFPCQEINMNKTISKDDTCTTMLVFGYTP